ncbi:glycosyltransferase family 9 protein [Dyella soli]|uniref:Lipopolysaccharide heptosyltransferase family protein n=1 Tax=Dyella soli TaxID=522319 RepID=A0A4R0YQG0_9GAMM|nr:glycosyltransferase family 9 protein [Dyella soli]TCI08820.1 lipopolysaccharide heptosyltransferase family protein [Dyella soli]
MNKTIVTTRQEPIPRKGIFRILVCRPNHRLGNTILLTPLITELEQRYKGAEIDIISEGDIAEEVFASFFSVKNVFCLPRRGFKHPVAFLGLLHQVRRTSYDLIVDPCLGSNFSRTLTRFLKGRYKLGFSDEASGSGLTHAVPTSVARKHMAKRPVNLLRWSATEHWTEQRDYPTLDIRLTEPEHAQGRHVIGELLSESQQTVTPPVVGIFANATGAKRYPMEWWSEFIATFKQLSPQASIIELIPAHGHSMLGAEWPGYYSSDIRRMGAVMAGMDLLISADCGVMHLAVASKVPTVGMFSVTDASVYAPYGLGSCPLLTRGMSAQEAARQVVAAFPGLLGQPAALAAVRSGTQGVATDDLIGDPFGLDRRVLSP